MGISTRDKCFNVIYNDKTKEEEEKLKADGKWIFPEIEKKDEHKKNILDKYKEEGGLKMTPHRLARNIDIKESMYYGLDWSDHAWIDKMEVGDSNLIKIAND